jgi:hypothetical protein
MDGYSGAFLFKGQVTGFGQANVSETLTQRRTISLAPGLAVPSHATLAHNTDRWILGTGITDYHQGAATRTLYSARRSEGLTALLTPAEAALDSAGIQVHSQFVYLKSTTNTQTDAEYDPFWEVYLAAENTAAVAAMYFVKHGQILYLARSVYVDVEGFAKVEADQVDPGYAVTVDFDGPSNAYDIVSETAGFGDIDVPCILLDANKIYRYETGDDQKVQAGEKALVVPASVTTPTVNQALVLDGAKWRVWSVVAVHDAWLCRIRRA